jgi:hypothetical protein
MKLVLRRAAGAYPVALAVVLIVALGASFFASQEAPSVSNSKPAGPMPSVSVGGLGGPIGLVGALYGDNGLNCTLPPSPISGPDINYLVPKVVQDPAFLGPTKGHPYIFYGGILYGNGTQIIGGKVHVYPNQTLSVIGGTTIHSPPGAELTFYSYGPGTTCQDSSIPSMSQGNGVSGRSGEIVVHVPLENGAYNLTAIWVHPSCEYLDGQPCEFLGSGAG